MEKGGKGAMSDYLFVTLAAQRCRQLYDGAEAKVEMRSKKLTRVAQEEISKDLVPYEFKQEPIKQDKE